MLDKQITYLNQEKYVEHLRGYAGEKYEVGKDIKGTSLDENCADFCIKNECDFLTVDKSAYTHFFKIKSIESVEIFQFLKKEPAASEMDPRPIYCIRYKTKQ